MSANKILVLSDKDAKDIKSRLDNEEVFTVPNLELKDGKYSFAGTIEIRNRKDYYAYIRKHKELVEFLYENYDPYVINNYRKNLAILLFSANAEKRDTAAKLLNITATKSATAAQTGFNAALLACPIGWIVAGIGLLVAALVGLIARAKYFSLDEQMKRAEEGVKRAT